MSVNEILERNEALIAEYGHAVIHVFADPERGLPSFSYSIGMQDRGWPEIILSGIPPQSAQPLINDVVARLKERGKPPAEGEILDGLLKGGFLMRLRALSEAEIEINLCLACRRSGDLGREPPKAFQLIFQDPERRWPEDSGYSCPLALLLAQSREEETKQ